MKSTQTMASIFTRLLSLLLIHTCSARRYSSVSGSSGTSALSTEAIIGLSVAGGVVFIALMILLIICRVKLIKNRKRRINDRSLAVQMAFAQENQYKPPNFSQPPPPPYTQPVQYSGFNTQTRPTITTTMTPVS
ncbi:unnamed protein product [Adineta ricciae]|uniref:Uncharacterized protein n=1 Tax=Adineta ricciae TaxID=249248 RepID=A0A815TA01_ADIRI|nr:unnamed protein product [Adineta ricciae]CAF1502142.1 unnamed protein product [Adineta ricciae]